MSRRTCAAALFLLAAALPAISQERTSRVNGKPVSQAELDAIVKLAPQELHSTIANDPSELLRYYGLVDRMAELAEKAGLPAESPLKEQLTLARKQMLASALSERYFAEHPTSPEDERKFYAAHTDDYTAALVKGLCVPVESPDKAAAALTTAQALARRIQSGEDFDDVAAKYPIGDFSNVIRKTDAKVPDTIRTAVFALAKGGTTAPIALPNGVYILRLQEVSVRPFEDVRGDVVQRLQMERFLAWMNEIRKSVTVEAAR